MSAAKRQPEDLAELGGPCLFERPRPVSNLARPDFGRIAAYARQAVQAHTFSDHGPLATRLEQALAHFHETPHCVSFSSGFWALGLAMRALARPGAREVVMPALTYRRMADIAAWAGLTPRFCEVDALRMTNTADCAAPCVGEDTALLLGVHPICGLADIAGLQALAARTSVPLLFDSVESVYERSPAGRIGGFGAAEVFSLGASKLINGFEGGYVTTHDPRLADQLRTHGRHFPLHELHAAMALASLEELDTQVHHNRLRYEAYQDGLAGQDGLRLVPFDPADRPAYKNILVELTDGWGLARDLTLRLLHAEGVLARAYYPQPLHRQAMSYPHIPARLPVSEWLAGRYLLLPCGEQVSLADVRTITGLLAFLGQHAPALQQRLAPREHP